eukprot:TRINITY_DN1062_c0_g3_i2.p1 TRINITY_DN1062_c0_g3~~TRINITY_DN1062_c0_g3_i2.p1  ORF type:complete len:108 (-),score=9.52 TRINITY_DN1062_c0_g3_i2:61-384(-)
MLKGSLEKGGFSFDKKTSLSESAASANLERRESMFALGSYISADWAVRLYSEYLKMKTEGGITEKDRLILKDTYDPDTGEFNYFPLNTPRQDAPLFITLLYIILYNN